VSENTLTAVTRTEFGKGAARRTRRAGLIPAVLYGPGVVPVHLALPAHETFLLIKGTANPVLTLSFDGRTELALVKDIQREPVKAVIEHIDLILVRKGVKVSVDVPVVAVGVVESGSVVTHESQTVTVLADPSAIPAQIEVNLEPLEVPAIVRAGDLVLPAGVTLETDVDAVVIAVGRQAAETEGESEESAESEPEIAD
jgi:large subunit ribosomal protein L25